MNDDTTRSNAPGLVHEAAEQLLAAVDAHKRYWARVDWGSDQAERTVEIAQQKLRDALASDGAHA